VSRWRIYGSSRPYIGGTAAPAPGLDAHRALDPVSGRPLPPSDVRSGSASSTCAVCAWAPHGSRCEGCPRPGHHVYATSTDRKPK